MMLVGKRINRGLLGTCFVLLLLGALVRPAWAQQSSGKLLVAYSGLITMNTGFVGS